jgi:hypothetical protein|tara:strand:+ start:4974 stop:5693 length:720 start_codon:yes stop_codon:yes gene_type:complete
MIARELTERGLEKYREQLNLIRSGELENIKLDLLSRDQFSTPFSPEIEISSGVFSTMYEVGKSILSDLDNKVNFDELETNSGFWSFASAVHFNQIVEKDQDGKWKIRQLARYIYEPDDYRVFYRHLLYGPTRLLYYIGDEVKPILSGKPFMPGEIFEQTASRQNLIMDIQIIRMTIKLGWDSRRRRWKPGFRSQNGRNVRDIEKQRKQLDLNFHIQDENVSTAGIISMLPPAFQQWLSS